MPCAELAVELTRHRLARCYFVSLHCQSHGDIRAALPNEPKRKHPCPLCQWACDCTLLGVGGTHRPLPFWTEFGRVSSRQWHGSPLLS